MRPAGARWAATRRRWCRPPAVGRPAARRQAGEQVGGCALGTALRELKQLDRQVLQRLVTAAEARRVTMRTPSSGWSERGWFTGCSPWRPLAYHWAVTPIGDRSRCTRWTSVCSGALAGTAPQMLVHGDDLFAEYRGALVENYVAQQLAAASGAAPGTPATAGGLYYWRSTGGMAEVDFLLERGNAVLPLEVRAGINPRSKSLQSFDSQFSAPGLVRSTLLNLKRDGRVANIPLYALPDGLRFAGPDELPSRAVQQSGWGR